MEIELYVNTEKGKIFSDQGICGSGRHFVRDVFIGLSYEEEEMKKQLERIAKQYHVEFSVYDIGEKRYRSLARSKGVRTVPTVIVGHHKFEEDFEMSEIIELLPGHNKISYEHEKIPKNYICPRCQSTNIKIFDDLSGYCNECNEAFMNGAIRN